MGRGGATRFQPGNPGGGRAKGVLNKATLAGRELGQMMMAWRRVVAAPTGDAKKAAKQEFETYWENAMKRIFAGEAPHLEVYFLQMTFGKAPQKIEIEAPAKPAVAGFLARLPQADKRVLADILMRAAEVEENTIDAEEDDDAPNPVPRVPRRRTRRVPERSGVPAVRASAVEAREAVDPAPSS